MVVIALSGLHGAGKTTAARALVKEFGLRYVSAGELFRQLAVERGMGLEEFSRYAEHHPEVDREIDRRTEAEAEKGNVLIDARLAGWMVKRADIRILLTAPLETRVRRIAKREGRGYAEVLRETTRRERSEARRFKRFYGIDVGDWSIFDLVLNTERLSPSQTARVLKFATRELVGGRR